MMFSGARRSPNVYEFIDSDWVWPCASAGRCAPRSVLDPPALRFWEVSQYPVRTVTYWNRSGTAGCVSCHLPECSAEVGSAALIPGVRLRKLRQDGLTQARAAALVGVAHNTGSRWESERADISNFRAEDANNPGALGPQAGTVLGQARYDL